MNKRPRRLFDIILALLVAIGGWVFVVYNYYPMTDVNYNNVEVSFSGERALADRGLAVSSVKSDGISATLNQKRVDVNTYSSDDITAMADVSECVAGDNSVRISVTSPPETSVIKSGPATISVNVERTDSAYMDIDVVYESGAPEDAEPIAYDLSQVQAEVVCAASKLGTVRSIAAVLNYDEVGEETKSYTANLVALDKDGNIVPHAVIYPEEISLDASAGVTKTVKLTVPVNSKNNDNYDRKYTAPETVTIKGSEEALAKITSVNANEIDIRYMYENGEVPIEYDLPEGVYPANESHGAVLKVSVQRTEEKNTDDAATESTDE